MASLLRAGTLAAAIPAALAAVVPIAHAAPRIDYANYLGPVGAVQTPFQANDVSVLGNYALVADKTSLVVLDISDPSAPVQVGAVEMPGHWSYHVVAAGQHAYMTDVAGVLVVDVSVPHAPTIVATFAVADEARDVALDGSTLWVATGGGRALAVDVSTPASPTLSGLVDLGWFCDGVAVQDGVVAVVGDNWLTLVDGSDPAAPAVRSTIHVGWSFYSVAVQEELCWIGRGTGVLAYDVSDLSHPQLLSQVSFAEPIDIFDLVPAGHLLYVGAPGLGESYVFVLDFANATAPSVLGVYSGLGEVRNFAVHDGLAYLPTGFLTGMRVLDVSEPAGAPLRASVPASGEVASNGSLAFIASGGTLEVVDVGTSPGVLGTVAVPAHRVASQGTLAFVTAGANGLRVVDASVPGSPTVIAHLDVRVAAVTAAGNRVYAGDNHIIYAIDVSDPAEPAILGSLPMPGEIEDLAIEGNVLAAALSGSWNGTLALVDVSDPTALSLVGSVTGSEFYTLSVAISGDFAYVTGPLSGMGLAVVDIADPAAPAVVSSLALGELPQDIAIRDGHAYIGTEYAGLIVADVRDPAAPRIVGGLDVPGNVRSLAVDGNGVYLMNNSFLRIAPLQRLGTRVVHEALADASPRGGAAARALPSPGVVLGAAHPNPFRGRTTIPFSLDRPARVRADVYDVSGRLVRHLVGGQVPAGAQVTEWDGRDTGGAIAAPGTYFIRIGTAGAEEVRRVTIVR